MLGPKVRTVLPNSRLIRDQLEKFYPEVKDKKAFIAYPGVEPGFMPSTQKPLGKAIGFLGKEWKRKGLDIACKVVERMRQHDPDITFLVAGCDPDEVRALFRSEEHTSELQSH